MLKNIKRKISNFVKILKNIFFMVKMSWRYCKSRYFYAIIDIAISTLTPFIYLILPKFIIDEVAGEKRWDIIVKYIIILLIVTVIVKFVTWIFTYFQNLSTSKGRRMNSLIFVDHFLKMDYKNLEDSTIQDLCIKNGNNINFVAFVDETVVGFFTNLLQLIGYSYIIIQLNPLIIIAILFIIKFNSMIADKNGKVNFEFEPVIAKFSRRYQYLFNLMIGFDYGKEIRINNAADWLENRYKKETNEYLKSFKAKQNKTFVFNIYGAVINIVQTIIMYGYSAYMAIKGNITIGDFSVYVGAITNFVGSFSGFFGQFIGFKYLSEHVDDYHKYLELILPEHQKRESIDINVSDYKNHEIEFVNVSFKYPNTENYVLENVSIKIIPGEKLSIVGYNGAGKSTFIKLICRLYEPSKGKILYNGIDILTINYDQYRELISVVFQDFKLFAFSAKENIVLANSEDNSRIQDAVLKSGLSSKFNKLKEGLETSVNKEFDENGIEFSGGESQKLACARAYYKDTPIVILDEPTSSLDPMAENELYERFNNIIGHKTAIYISHRLASVKFCDKVAVFVSGKIVEYGTHDSLMAQDGAYRDMYTKQAMYYVDEVN